MVVRGASTAVSTLVLSLCLGLWAPRPLFNSWTLVAGLVAWLNLIEIGYSSSVVRFVSEEFDRRRQAFVVRIVERQVGYAAVVAMAAFAFLSVVLPSMYPSTARAVASLPAALFIAAAFSTATLVLSPSTYFFVGRLETKVIAVTNIAVRLSQFVGILAFAVTTHQVIPMAFCYGLPPLIGGLYLRSRAVSDRSGLVPDEIAGLRARVIEHTKAAAIWTISGAFISNLDIPLVGRFAPEALGEYSICLSGGLLVAGLHTALISPIVARSANHSDNLDVLTSWIVSVARRTNLMMGLCVSALIAGAVVLQPLLRFSDRQRFIHIFVLLSGAQLSRILAGPYCAALLGTGDHKRVVLSPILEAVMNTAASVVLGLRFGATGVAAGTLLGAILSLTLHIGYNMKRTTQVPINPREYLCRAVLPAVAVVGPVGLLAWVIAG